MNPQALKAQAFENRLHEVAAALKRSVDRFGREYEDALTEVRALYGEAAGERDARATQPGPITAAQLVAGMEPMVPVELSQCRTNKEGDVVRVDGMHPAGGVILFLVVGRPLRDPPMYPIEMVAQHYPIVLAAKVVAAEGR